MVSGKNNLRALDKNNIMVSGKNYLMVLDKNNLTVRY